MNWEVAYGRASKFEWLTADGATVASEDDMSEEGLQVSSEDKLKERVCEA